MLKLGGFLKFFKHSQELAVRKILTRNLLAPAYQCNEVWENRLNQPLFQKVNLEEFYYELDQKYQKTKSISFIDVDIFANAIGEDVYDDELLDLVHKLRLSKETSSSLRSMSYAVLRTLLRNKKIEDIHNVLDDRLNYGVFLDAHMTNILLDYFWEQKDFVSGTRIASQAMLQEDDEHPISNSLSLLHCFNCLLKKGEWSFPPEPEEPKEEVKIRVKYIRNPYNDDHFDLKDCQRIIGKTLMYLSKNKSDAINNSFAILGATLFGSINKAKDILEKCIKEKIPIIKEIIELIPEEKRVELALDGIELISKDVNSILLEEVNKNIQKCSESDINEQCKLFEEWNKKRLECLSEKEKILSTIERLKNIENLKKELGEKETKLWFFENEEKIELEIQEKEELEANEIKPVFKKNLKGGVDEEYIPPSVRKLDK